MTDDNERVLRLYLRHQTMVRDFVLGLVRNPHDAEDIHQEVSVAILKTKPLDISKEDFPRWCRGIARNKVLHYWRGKKRSRIQPNSDLMDAIEEAFECSASEVYEEDILRRQALSACYRKLSDTERDIISRRYEQGHTSGAIAEALQLAAQTVRKRLMQIRNALRLCIERGIRAEAVDV